MYKREKVKGYEQYEVDTNGIIYSKTGKPLKYSINHGGYCIINFYVNHKRIGFAVHTIVAKQFLPNNDPDKTQVNHKDGNTTNNSVDNLEWVTPLENTHHAIYVLGYDKSGSNNPGAKAIIAYHDDGSIFKSFTSIAEAAKEMAKEGQDYRAVSSRIWRALKGLRHTYNNLHWKYA